ncbi:MULTISPECIES: TrkH family potassium uptake protein [Flammeovirga]|uniref:TrkH family potassium uptake protein n=1 Tax=Flammeovirga agarivorans TaxID=2726742 RepID=A0A7X8SMG6_9BACT|nr:MULTISPECIES: TrkH family potassium uptake protein [Flammeovirga]NLR92925.1 TrkH family potassium uptake protein [Flammeovirga agarivorans]
MQRKSQFNVGLICRVLGVLILLNGIFMFTCLPFAFYFGDGDWKALVQSGVITVIAGGFGMLYAQKMGYEQVFKKKDGYIIVSLGWALMAFFGSLPYIFSEIQASFADAYFETISGYSTTGASILTDIEGVGKGILFWRSLTQWIGGMGIIVLAVAVLPFLGIGGMQLFVAEAPGISPDKLQPRIKETAKRLWWVYAGLTGVETILLMTGGMSFYDALNHALTTMATGGFSTYNDSAASMSPYIQYILIFFMVLAGTNFTLNYFFFKRMFKAIWKNEEYKYYLGIISLATIGISSVVIYTTDLGIEKAFRDALFQVVSIITTTGYVSADYTAWAPFATMIVFVLMFCGGMAGSTAGGVKIVRHIILFKNSFLELKRQLHPTAIIPVRFNDKAVKGGITFNVLAFIMAYFLVFGIGILVMSALGLDLLTAIGAVATSLGNIGPGVGTVGPVDNFAHLPDMAKWVLSFLMLLGRLELFTVMIIFTPYFWSRF